MKYAVMVDNNDYQLDIGERMEFGSFDTAEEAVEMAEAIVDDYLLSAYEPGMTASTLFTTYLLHGWDPFIGTHDASCKFLASRYAYEKCLEICGEILLS